MKKLNRKGFTLVELLAVIIILAIVVGISIPAVNSIINGSKNSALGVAVEGAVDYLQDQYDIYNIDASSASKIVNALINKGETSLSPAQIEELGFDTANVKAATATLESDAQSATAKICVTVTEVETTSDYFTTNYWTIGEDNKTATPTAGSGVKNQAGNGCGE